MVSDMEVLDDVIIVARGMHESRDNVNVESYGENCTPGLGVAALVQGGEGAVYDVATPRPRTATRTGSCG
jgi:hypothetical protein